MVDPRFPNGFEKEICVSENENKLIIRRFIDEVLNQRNFATLDEIVGKDFIEEVPFPGQGPGRDGLRDIIKIFAAAFPDMHWEVEEQIAEGDKVATRFTFTGTHRGEFLGIPATGRAVSVWGIVIDVVRDGTFIQSRIIMDTLGLLGQLGATGGPQERR